MSYTFTYGKHKGKPIEEVPEDYIQWVIDQDRLRMTQMQAEIDRRRTAAPTTKLEGWMLTQIVTGGQTGADQGALFAASAMEIPTGGWAPLNYETEEGPADWLKDFGLDAGSKYRDQYGFNTDIADGTLIFGRLTGGTNIMKELVKMNKRPLLCIAGPPWTFHPDECATWIRQNQIHKLHVGGNKESKSAGIQEAVQAFLMDVLTLMQKGWKDREKIPF